VTRAQHILALTLAASVLLCAESTVRGGTTPCRVEEVGQRLAEAVRRAQHVTQQPAAEYRPDAVNVAEVGRADERMTDAAPAHPWLAHPSRYRLPPPRA
jgi:hypothetical protein